MINIDDDLDVFHLQSIVDGDCIIQSLSGIVGNFRIDWAWIAGDIDCRGDICPILGDGDGATSIYSSKSILVRDVVTRAIDVPWTVTGIVLTCTVNQNMLNVAPSQIGIGFENQCDDAAGQRCSRWGASEIVGVVIVRVSRWTFNIGRRDAFTIAITVRCDQDVGTGFSIPWLVALMCDGGHCDGLTSIRIAILVWIIIGI